MIYIFSAFYAEAKNIIDHYGLKKEKSPEMVRFDVFANESIRLVITGVGEINAAAAVSNIGGAYGISPDDEILNVGCGAGFSSDICLGSIFLGNKLTEPLRRRGLQAETQVPGILTSRLLQGIPYAPGLG